jgi:hypothetical protein
MKRIKTTQSLGRDYKKMLKDYFGKFLYGLEVKEEGGRVQVQLVYFDFKHIDTVRRELAQMMPEVEFTKLKRDYTITAQTWALSRMLYHDYGHSPVLYVQNGDTLVKTTVRDIAMTELNQLELEEDDITYGADSDLRYCCTGDDEKLEEHSWD